MPISKLAPKFRGAPLLSFLVICGLSSHATPLKADIVFSNVGNGASSTFGASGAFLVAPSGFGPNGGPNSLGDPFIAGDQLYGATGTAAYYLLTDVQVLVAPGGPAIGDSDFNVSIFSNTGVPPSVCCAGLPGSFIAGGDGVATGAPSGAPSLVTVPISGPDPVLTSGTSYWIVMTYQGILYPNSGTIWYTAGGFFNYLGGGIYSNIGEGWMLGCCGGPGYPYSNPGDAMFQVDGTPYTPVVPEPANLVFLVAIIFAPMALLRLRRGKLRFTHL